MAICPASNTRNISFTNSINPRANAQREARMIDNKIQAIDGKIAVKEKLISLKQDQVTAAKEVVAKCDEEIAIIKELIDIRKQQVAKEFGIKQKKLDLLKESRDLTKESRDLTKESRDLTKEVRDLHIQARDATIKFVDSSNKLIEGNNKLIEGNNKLIEGNNKLIEGNNKSIALKKEAIAVIEKMIAIMEKNPAKYGNLTSSEVQQQPEVIEAKYQVTQLANDRVSQYPKAEKAMLTDTAKNIVEATFNEIKPVDTKANIALFSDLTRRIEAALDQKHDTLAMTKDNNLRQFISDHYKSVEQFSKIKKLDYLDLALKDIKL